MGLEPTTLRLKAARSTDWARKALTISYFTLPTILPDSSTLSAPLFHMTTWPSGLRRVTRNHFSSGGVGSNPAVVVFYIPTILFLFYLQKMVPPRFELGSREPESRMLPLHHGTLRYISSLTLLIPRFYFPYSMPTTANYTNAYYTLLPMYMLLCPGDTWRYMEIPAQSAVFLLSLFLTRLSLL